MKRTKKQCTKCSKEISLSNFSKHYNSCKGIVKEYLKITEDWKQDNGLYKCPYCEKEYKKNGICTHIWRNHTEEGKICVCKNNFGNKGKPSWNSGLTKETDERVKRGGYAYHKNYTEGKFESYWKGKHHKKESIDKLSESGKLAHKEGRAWNIGMSRWNNEPSYPEKFFMEVIKNEFEDKNYQKEYPVGIYSLDFAWIEKKKAIEIDGEQHQRFEEYRERDKRKDMYLTKEGWKILRIVWKDMFHNTKEKIKICK